ncbi:looped-hinge helix DNA binding domain-containing protein, AbrB family [Natronoarchaeum philippinense]|uniref:Looped-hinge helix DNA binding domain-containing protein, AbrB family n=1 Tax=Natronoarchaeum philippinense TaxID=558529 RepID=A0A285P6B6_NATPI|nr:AbrB/MazE/SpoVT family DNA-binding domain-containing protein [Natronoarchaeum philippinense]SNZ15421.1 looped-hinge helix DNA binding domain-containing protein, AbrB family [Natronoarchaeum philippinense]
MPGAEKRTVGERGQVTLPKEFREEFGLHGGDEVTIRKESGQIVIEKPVSREDLAEGYRRRAEQHQALADEMADVSQEANDTLGDVPEW